MHVYYVFLLLDFSGDHEVEGGRGGGRERERLEVREQRRRAERERERERERFTPETTSL